MVLKGKVLVTKVLKESRFDVFKDLKEQDIIAVSVLLPENMWWSNNGYTADLRFENLRTRINSIIPLNSFDEVIDTFECVQLPQERL